MKVYNLDHYKPVDDYKDIKSIGVYETYEQANEAVNHLKTMVGFKDHQDGFLIEEFEVLGQPQIRKDKVETVFYLVFVEDDDTFERYEIIGYYFNEADGQNVLDQLRNDPKYQNYSYGFYLGERTLNQTHWETGFVSWSDI